MKPNKNQKILFFAAILALLMLPLYFILRSEKILADKENIYRFRPFRLIDPGDVMRGNYLVIDFNSRVELKEGDDPGRGNEIYVVVEKDSAGFAFFDYATTARPSGSNYFTTRAAGFRMRGERLNIKIPFDQYFINEENAELAEKLYDIEIRNPETDMYIEVAISNGESLLKGVYVDDMPLNEFLNGLTPEERKEIEEIYEDRNIRFRRRFR